MEKNFCSVCRGTGWILEKSEKGIIAKRCKCYHDKKSQILFEQANIPKRYKNCSFKNFEIHDDSHQHALKIAKQFVKNYPVQDVGLLFIGPCGVGKTHLAVAFIHELIHKKSVPSYFCDFRELIRSIQSTFTPESSLTESDVLYPIFQKDVLVLDELGAKRTTAWVEETVFYIINNRYNNKKLTILTSNYLDHEEDEEDTREPYFKKGEESLVDRIGIRLRSRLYEMCKIVNMWGKDYRKEIKQGSYRF
ncbi:MAG: ATP-binding protein [Candidatus Aminicenantes bacterium]|nr:ATP-binding protein [Candidatus Aminicenantes bacterium]